MTRKKALITGVSGQDGLALADFLVAKGYEVLGLALNEAPTTAFATVKCDIRETEHVGNVLEAFQPDEFYNLAALSNIGACDKDPKLARAINYSAWINILELAASLDLSRHIRFFQASSSEMFGNAEEQPQSESTPFAARNVYGETKVRAHQAGVKYRAEYGLKVSNGVLYNHEGPNRGLNFVTQKIAAGAAALKLGRKAPLQLGNLDAKRDWGHVRDTVRGMWLMLQHEIPDDFVLATGQTHTVRHFAEAAFAAVDLPLEWAGVGGDERGLCCSSGRVLVTLNPEFMRSEASVALVGDASKARDNLGWTPGIQFEDLVQEMVVSELARQQKVF